MPIHTNQCSAEIKTPSRSRKPGNTLLMLSLQAALLATIPFEANAAKVTSVFVSGPQTTVNDQGSDGVTKIAIAFLDTTGIWLDMEPSSTEANEKFQISLQNNTGEDISELWFEVVTQGGEDLGTRPSLSTWVSTISASQFGGLNVSESNLIVDQSDRHRFQMKFDPPLSPAPGNSMTIISNEDWVGFNKAGGKWWLNIDWNAEDNNGPAITSSSELTPNILANSEEGPLKVQSGENVSVAVTLNSGANAGKDADWWVAAQSSELGWFQYTVEGGWQPINSDLSDIKPGYQGALIDLNSPFELLSSSDIPKASYEIFFGVDQNMNGVLDFDGLVFDSVKVDVE
ncbi:MAG: hypothetical protein V3U75_09525 [Methylococcaceae bacterium]